jgi:pSer/pThr/pTyr-binding forkhead associated (FHA) protein
MPLSADRPRLPPKPTRIGRIPDNDLVVADLEVSRHHAELRKSPTGTYEIVDLGSHNGTFVNGKRVSRAALTEHDIVGIGHSTSASRKASCVPPMTRKSAGFSGFCASGIIDR